MQHEPNLYEYYRRLSIEVVKLPQEADYIARLVCDHAYNPRHLPVSVLWPVWIHTSEWEFDCESVAVWSETEGRYVVEYYWNEVVHVTE